MSSTNSRLIFHIGHHKTGSTAIQEAFATGHVAVEGKRILYTARLGHNYLVKHFETYGQQGRVLKGARGAPGLSELSDLLRAGGFDYAVFSAEEFERADPAAFYQVLQTFFLPHVDETVVACYVRPHAARTLSSYAEQVKLGLFDEDLQAFHTRLAAGGRLAYAGHLARWSEIFGARFQARPMVRDLLEQGSVVHDFARLAFGAQAQIAVTEGAAANESLCLEDLVLLRHIQSSMKRHSRPLRHALGWNMAIGLAAQHRRGSGTRLVLHRSLAEDIRRSYLEDARALDAGIFAAQPVMERELDRAVDLAAAEPQSLEPSDHFGADALRSISVMAEMMSDMLDNAGEDWRGFLNRRRMAGVHADAPAAPAQDEPGRKRGGRKGGARKVGPGKGKAGKGGAGKAGAARKGGELRKAGRKAGGGKRGAGKAAPAES